MKNITIIYWSGTGNTQQMAVAVAEGAKEKGMEVTLKEVANASVQDVLKADAVALGCPSMGCEVLEEAEMEPFVEALEKEDLKGKPMALFGSFDWGDGQWMRDWTDRMEKLGVKLVAEGLTVQNTPDENGIASCKELGSKLADG
ncbi:flavodoxin [Petroclostridium sp. X23]|uniref:flavodoxin n=1 Tax=Petroclostridium sp. X23 TaxID=3045146 RepID=UPI0024ACF828|nr:flavodoxin [Petroclostridium sp. X23]WHH58658.1 flavodoxin [Petroclostridium sp. X23]